MHDIYLVISCLLSLMSILEEEITRDLKAEIAKDTARRDKAVVEGDGAKEAGKTLNALLQQQQPATCQGKLLIICLFNIAALKLILSLGSPLISPSRSLLSVI